VVKIDPLWIDVPVPLAQAKQLALGQGVSITFPGGGTAKSSKGRIIHVSSVADAASDTLRVRIEVANPVGRPAGERVSVKFLEGRDAAGIVEKQEQEPPRASLERRGKTHSAGAHQSEQEQNQRERVSEKSPFDVSEQQEPRPRDSQGEVHLGKVMTLTYPAYTQEADQRYHRLLTELAATLRAPTRTNYRIVLKGYTDSTGSRDDNLRISLQRAERLRELLAQNPHMAIDKKRITVEGHGPSNPVASNNTFEGRAQNRRVEIHIYGDGSEGGDFADFKWAHQPEQEQNQRERMSEKPPFDVLEQQERKHRDSEGEVHLGKVMTLTYPAYTQEADQRYHRLLTELAHSLKMPMRKKYRVVLKGYTDNSGSMDDNLRISLQRAERLRELLAQNPHMAIHGERITVEGHGPFNPVVSNQTAEGRAQNRRVEIHIYGDVSEGDDPAGFKDN
jgi:outer membrane protein OmpA-like peptidoglycan-associated protein